MIQLAIFIAVIAGWIALGCYMTRPAPVPSLVFPWPDDGP
jgi:hypothetical protein